MEVGRVWVWDVTPATRNPAETAAFVPWKGPWRLKDGRLLPGTPAQTACSARTAAP
jgi:hypothetical protein